MSGPLKVNGDFSRLKDHLIGQLRRLDDERLVAIDGACTGERTPNRSMLTGLEWCGRKVVQELWQDDTGRRFVSSCVREVQEERRNETATIDLGEKGRELQEMLERRSRIRSVFSR